MHARKSARQNLITDNLWTIQPERNCIASNKLLGSQLWKSLFEKKSQIQIILRHGVLLWPLISECWDDEINCSAKPAFSSPWIIFRLRGLKERKRKNVSKFYPNRRRRRMAIVLLSRFYKKNQTFFLALPFVNQWRVRYIYKHEDWRISYGRTGYWARFQFTSFVLRICTSHTLEGIDEYLSSWRPQCWLRVIKELNQIKNPINWKK